jgi:hypothetical protein
MKLTNFACKGAKPSIKPYKLSDGGRMFLLVKPNGSKLWQMNYTCPLGKNKLLSFGAYSIGTVERRKFAMF